MKLICHPISPYARKAMILARVHGIKIEEISPTASGPRGYNADQNPLGKIPALEWQPQQYLFDSRVICEYLDSRAERPILASDPHLHFLQKWQHALGDGLSDAVYNFRQEIARPENLHWDKMIKRHDAAIGSAIDTLETICEWLGEPWTFGNLAIVCALDYTGFRAGHLGWQERAPKLAAWHAGFRDDPAHRATYEYPE